MTDEDRQPVSGCVICYQEADRIEDCLRSLAFCDEVVVVDSGSTDGTCELAEALGARVVHNAPFPGFAAQRQLAVDHCKHDFVLCLDADERATAELAREVGELARARALQGGYQIRRQNRYLGKVMRFGLFSPDRKLRLFDRRQGAVVSRHPPHDRVELREGATLGELRGRLDHLNYRDFAAHRRTVDSYTRISAEAMAAAGRRGSLLDVLVHPPADYVKALILKRGILDGWRGALAAAMAAYADWKKYWRLWSQPRRGRGGGAR